MNKPTSLALALALAAPLAHAQTSPPSPAPLASPGPIVDEPIPPKLHASDEAPVASTTFEKAVAQALARNPSVEIAVEEVRRAHALMEEARAASLPTLAAVGTYTRLEGDRVANGVVVVPQDALGGTVTLNAPLLYPRGWVQWKHAGDQIDVARASMQDVRRTIAIEAARAYLTIIAQKRLLATARIARDNDRAHYEYTRARLVGGVGNRIDEVRAAQQLATDEATVQARATSLVQAREALGILVASDAPVDSATEEMPSVAPNVNDALQSAQSNRTDVHARLVAADAADRTVEDAWADYMPYLNLIAYPFLQNPATTTTPVKGWEAQLVLTIPLYDGGLRYGQEHERKALAHEARINVGATIRQAKSDVRSAFEELRRTDEALVQAQQAARFAKQALDLANQAYHAGATTNLEVIDAERQARDADTQAAVAEDASRQARLDFLAASGHFP